MHNTRHAIGETPHRWHLHETGPSYTPWEGVFLPVVCYSLGMLTFLQPQNIVPKAGRWILLVGPRSLNASVLDAIARLGERTPVRVLDGGNRFNAYKVARAAAVALCGGEIEGGSKVDEEWLLTVERRGFVELLKTPETQARIKHMLETGKPLRN